MKLKYDDNTLIIYLKNEIINNINFNVKDELESYFKQLFKKLSKYYNIEIRGFYNIKVYIDKKYGVVLELNKEDIDYYDYLDSTVDMRITIVNTSFWYEINDLDVIQLLKNKIKIYRLDNKIIIKDPIDIVTMSEFYELIYNTKKIENKLLEVDKIK